MTPQRYLGLALGVTAAATLSILAINWHADPFGLRDAPATSAAAAKRVSIREPFWHKVFAVTAVKPAQLILGTSRADAGLDPSHPGFAPGGGPVYNLSLPGASIDQMRELLVHAHRTRPVRLAVVGLDLESFIASGRTDFDPAVLAGNGESVPPLLSAMRLSLSGRALRATLEDRLGSPAADGPSLQELEGQRLVFRIAELKNFHSRLADLFPPWGPGSHWDTDPRRAASMRAFRELVAFARAEGIDLRLFISPVHARYLEAYQRVGWWPLFEAWKRALVASLAAEARSHPGRRPFALWDFSGYNAVTTEAVPARDDVKASMRWYVESSHYSRELGNVILATVLNDQRVAGAALGTRIDTTNIEAHLQGTRHGAENYRIAFPAEAAEVGEIVQFIRRSARK